MIRCSTELFDTYARQTWRNQDPNREDNVYYYDCLRWRNYDNRNHPDDYHRDPIPGNFIRVVLSHNYNRPKCIDICYFWKKDVLPEHYNYNLDAFSRFHQMNLKDFENDEDEILQDKQYVVGNSTVGHVLNSQNHLDYHEFLGDLNTDEAIVRERIVIGGVTNTIYWRMLVASFNQIPQNLLE